MKQRRLQFLRTHKNQDKPDPEFRFYIDSPKRQYIDSRSVLIKGWIIVDSDHEVRAMRATNNHSHHEVAFGLVREDVQNAIGNTSERALKSGFEALINYEDGEVNIEVDFGDGFRVLQSLKVVYTPEQTFDSVYNASLAENTAEQQILLENKKLYEYLPASDKSYVRDKNDPRLVAFYLPQFHPIAQNNEAWGQGFTEWANVTSAKPRFIGHQQPFLPADLGFYDLRLEDNVLSQVTLAKKYGIYAFCFYYYWFSGEKILDAPLNTFLSHREWDFNFMICWANENWTKRWDGRDKEVIIAQKYLKDDPLNFIKEVEPILLDPRYIRQNGKPLLAVYRGSELNNAKEYADVWRDYFLKKHNTELEIVTMLNFEQKDPRVFGFDTGVEFSPLSDLHNAKYIRDDERVPHLQERLLDVEFEGRVVDYRTFLGPNLREDNFKFPTYRSLTPSWDNEARKKGKGSLTLYGSNPDLYAEWLHKTLSLTTAKTKSPLIFLNAWNEWGEGSVAEPTGHQGHAVLRRTAEVLARFSEEEQNKQNFPAFSIRKTADTAVIVHLYYEKEWEEIRKRLEVLEEGTYDLFITVTRVNEHLLAKLKKELPHAHFYLVPNRGRDVLPFFYLLPKLRYHKYEFILKLHTKRTVHRDDGRKWFDGILGALLKDTKQVSLIREALNSGAALVGPKDHFVSASHFMGSNQKKLVHNLERLYGKGGVSSSLIEGKGFFAGTMFWARLDALDSLINLYFIPEDFDSERGQRDGTQAHTAERLIGLVLQIEKRPIYVSDGASVRIVGEKDVIKEAYKFAQVSHKT